ncbi:MAG: hypothetical protein P8X63_06300 [Desulfuromonadaceae bacterium]
MNKILGKILLSLLLLAVFGCSGYRAYLGLHGNSIRLHPEAHDAALSEDSQCLECHHPDHAAGPPTPHPGFKGCLKCHNDETGPAEK